jgi:predicted ATPase
MAKASIKIKPYLQRMTLRRDLNLDFQQYPLNIASIKELDYLTFHPDVTFLVGENGSGKSTVLEAIAQALGYSAEGGTLNARFSTTETQTTSTLHEWIRLARGTSQPRDGYFLRAESFFNWATYMDQVGYLDAFDNKSLHARSHGEAFMALLLRKLRGNGLYLFDEPEAALSPQRQLTALRRIHELVQLNSQFIIATHSPILLAYPNAKILQFSDQGIHEVSYESTDHYLVTRDFLQNYPSRLQQLFDDTDHPYEKQ